MLSVRWRPVLVGDVAVADVRFDPKPRIGCPREERRHYLDDEEGWRISNMVPEPGLVNQTPVAPSQSHRLRSEDLVRASEASPDFCFRLVAGPHGCANSCHDYANLRCRTAGARAPGGRNSALTPAPLPEGEGSMREPAFSSDSLRQSPASSGRLPPRCGGVPRPPSPRPLLPTNLRSVPGEGGSGTVPQLVRFPLPPHRHQVILSL